MDNKPDKKEKHVDYVENVNSKQESAHLFTDKKRKEKDIEENTIGGF
ncbi:MAG TPA: hypothetical protein VK142_05695 [Bacillota bacterium]|nr:hypothetical protein [Bacillota bacterium]